MNSVQQSWSGMIEIGSVPMRAASGVISSLSIPTSGRSISHRRRLGDGGQVLERLRRDLADHLARHQRARPPVAREPLGDPQHQPPVDDDAQLRPDGEQHLLLQLAERHQHAAASAADSCVSSAAISRTFSCDARDRIG